MYSKPNFLGIGAQKAGTTWLWSWLIKHPDIWMPGKKEIGYFANPQNMTDKEYGKYFKKCHHSKICGEVSPDYLYKPLSSKRIRRYNHEMKLIVILRNPVDRAISQYKSEMRKVLRKAQGRPIAYRRRKSLISIFDSDVSGIKSRGHYSKQLQVYFKLFPRRQIIIEQYTNIGEGLLQRVYHFLNISTDVDYEEGQYFRHTTKLAVAAEKRYHKIVDSMPITDRDRKQIEEYYKPHNESLYKLLGYETCF